MVLLNTELEALAEAAAKEAISALDLPVGQVVSIPLCDDVCCVV